MADTTFTNGVTLTDADWFNDVNRLHYTIFSDPANAAAAFTAIKQAASDTATGAIEIAIQSEMEAGSSATLAVTPGRQHFHPSAAKAFGFFDGSAGTPAFAAGASYNCDGITDNGAGSYTITITNDFSSVSYAVVANAAGSADVVQTNIAGVDKAAGSFRLDHEDSAGSNADSANVNFACFGDL